ncbi:hypothetical protein BCR33DRAFT_718978 [Rhizoclosmatium globosum]|uniref:Pecanex C-terminal domain-containing protein n=1 Tax=Rhizoclosmatium globosum TaxID=329046 RepID=A0A1Y2C3A8_9FUNG|nr:hypothetical protein BCR33DRAFT_718978 [Rhizoclosmatium globosum]|eukprot:ORY41374.1 hypothetical protein BCR33DRAFT_718978 [Rhizoclosmatium globosum]
MGAPVINSYKVPLAILRLFGSFTGGVLQYLVFANTRDSDVIGLVFGTITALIIFIVPAIISGAISTLNNSGMTYAGIGALAGEFHYSLREKSSLRVNPSSSYSKYYDAPDYDEDDSVEESNEDGIRHIKFSGGNRSWRPFWLWVLPNFDEKESWIGVAVKAGISGLIVGLSAVYLQFGQSMTLLVFSHLSICSCIWSLTSGSPIDPNTYFSEDAYGIDGYTRPAYCLILLSSLAISTSSTTNTVILIVLCIVPISVASNILPSFRIFIAWFFEIVHVMLLGGTAQRVFHDSSSFCLSAFWQAQSLFIWLCSVHQLRSVFGCITSSRITATLLTLDSKPWIYDSLLLLIRSAVSIGISYWLTQGITLSTLTSSPNLSSCHCFIFLGLQVLCNATLVPMIPNPLVLLATRFIPKRAYGYILTILHYNIPIISLIYTIARTMTLVVNVSPILDGSSFTTWSGGTGTGLFLYATLLSRIFRMIWVHPIQSAWDLTVWGLAVRSGTVVGCWILETCVGRFLSGSVVVVVGIYTFLTDKKLRTEEWVLHLILSLLISPFGLRSWWSWKDEEFSPHPVSQLYKQLLPSLLETWAKRYISYTYRTLGFKIMFVRVVESWYEGYEVIVSGLEMRGTSCHEAERVILEEVSEEFEQGRWVYGCLLEIFLAMLSTNIRAYSDSSSVLTGVLDHPDTLALIQPLFFKCLVYMIWRNIDSIIGTTRGDLRCARLSNAPISESLFHSFHKTWIRHFLGLNSNGSSPPLSVNFINRLYTGEIADSVSIDLRHWFQENSQYALRQVVVKAWRFAVKITWQEQIDGSSSETFDDLLSTLDDHYDNWHLTVHHSEVHQKHPTFVEELSWSEAVERNIPNIFIFGVAKKDEDLTTKEGAETTTQKRRKKHVSQQELNDTLVKGIWANMAYELFYLTNDDDERYSIQAHKSADPPLGYPSWMSRERIGISLLK